MKRILAAFKNKLEDMKIERNVKRLTRSIETAIDNAEDAVDDLEAKKADLVEQLPLYTNYNDFVQELSTLFDQQKEQQDTIARLKEIKDYLNEEVKISEEDKK